MADAATPRPTPASVAAGRWVHPDYGRIVLVRVHGEDLVVAFADGDVAQVPIALCYPDPAVLDPGTFSVTADGSAISVEGEDGGRVTTGWSVFRSRTDAAFARHVSARAAEERVVIGLRVETFRLAAGLDRAVVAERAGLPEARVAAIEAGEPVPDLMDALGRILALLGRGWGALAGLDWSFPTAGRPRRRSSGTG